MCGAGNEVFLSNAVRGEIVVVFDDNGLVTFSQDGPIP